MTRSLSTCAAAVCLALALAGLGGASLAADPPAKAVPAPSPAKGQQLAERLCTNCHLVTPEQAAVSTVGPPSFTAIANKPGQTPETIEGALILPHPPMPDMQISTPEMMDIIAYLQTLRKNDLPPLLPPRGEPKPTYPKPG